MEFSVEHARVMVAEVSEAEAAVMRAEAERFAIYARFADAYRYVPEDGPVLAGTERLVQWGGDGVPGVAEFCTLELAAALRTSEESVRLTIGDALAVRHRLPSVWARVMDGGFRVWRARELARVTRQLSFDQVIALDAEVGPLLVTMSYRRLLNLVKGRVMQLQPERAQTEYEHLKGQCQVVFDESAAGFTRVWATIPAGDAVMLKAQVARLAGIIGQLRAPGDAVVDSQSRESLKMRHALALGVLANPALALQLIQASVQSELPDLDPECPARGMRGHSCGRVDVDPEKLLPHADLVIHLSDETLREGVGVVREEKLGPLLAGWVKDLVGHTRVRVRPVLDAGGMVATDAYECPPRMREAVELRNGYEVFPFSQRLARGLDLDHTQPWASTPPPPPAEPPTRPGNLGPLSRKVHRAKTHAGWQLSQPLPGVFCWTSPLGFGYLVTPSHSWMTHDPTGRIAPTAA